MRAALAVLLSSLASPTLASDFSLALPIDCVLGDTCHIQQFMDRDAGPGARDFTCGPLSYDGHQGTDFALATLADMRAGVAVLAAADGTVLGVRDGMRDVLYSADTADEIEGRDCGNGVVLNHGAGWVTQYCHLKQGSVVVKTGDDVKAGDILGAVGLSGRTQFPHVHLSVRYNDTHLDPFDGSAEATCSVSPATNAGLWRPALDYVPGGFLDIGFSDAVPDYDAVQDGTAATPITRTSQALVLYAFAFGSQSGDQIRLRADGPEGVVFDQTVTLERTQARVFRASGRRMRGGLPAGTYTGTISFLRNGQEIDRATRTIEVQ